MTIREDLFKDELDRNSPLNKFLEFLDKDMEKNPDRLIPLTPEFRDKCMALITHMDKADIEIDINAPLSYKILYCVFLTHENKYYGSDEEAYRLATFNTLEKAQEYQQNYCEVDSGAYIFIEEERHYEASLPVVITNRYSFHLYDGTFGVIKDVGINEEDLHKEYVLDDYISFYASNEELAKERFKEYKSDEELKEVLKWRTY